MRGAPSHQGPVVKIPAGGFRAPRIAVTVLGALVRVSPFSTGLADQGPALDMAGSIFFPARRRRGVRRNWSASSRERQDCRSLRRSLRSNASRSPPGPALRRDQPAAGAFGLPPWSASPFRALRRSPARGSALEASRFYTLVAGDTREQEFAARRQRFLVEQEYRYRILDACRPAQPAHCGGR